MSDGPLISPQPESHEAVSIYSEESLKLGGNFGIWEEISGGVDQKKGRRKNYWDMWGQHVAWCLSVGSEDTEILSTNFYAKVWHEDKINFE